MSTATVEKINEQDLVDILSMYGFNCNENKLWRSVKCYQKTLDDAGAEVFVMYYPEGFVDFTMSASTESDTSDIHNVFSTYRISKLLKRLDRIHASANQEIFQSVHLQSTSERNQTILAASSKDYTQNIARVKSSNVWGYSINIKDRKSGVGDVIVQFKGPQGGPGDVYIYYDVPVRVYARWQSAPSKGHYFWQYIRNFYKYSKLTGDKRGRLPNAVN